MPAVPPDMDVPRLITWAAGFLEASGVTKPRVCAEQLLSHCTGRSRVDLYAHYDRPVSRRDREGYAALLRRRAAHHITDVLPRGRWGSPERFCGLRNPKRRGAPTPPRSLSA
jgi:methylase of polypeptide subunit release factors